MDGSIVEADPGAVGEAFTAYAANERPLPCVDPGVDLQSPRLSETFPTLITAVGLFSCVGPLMGPDPSQMGKPPPTEATGVRPLPCVNPPMNLQSPRLAETLPAVSASVGPGPCVHIEVDAEVTVRVEGPAALGAKEARRFMGMLRALVLQQLGGSSKGGRTVHTGVQGQKSGSRPASVLLLLGVCLSVLVVADLSASRDGTLARQAGKSTREPLRVTELRAGQARS